MNHHIIKLLTICGVLSSLLYAPAADSLNRKIDIPVESKEGNRAWLEATRGWIESGNNFYPYSTGINVGIGTTTPGPYKLDVAGSIRITGGIHDGVSYGSSGYVLKSTGADIYWAADIGSGGEFIQNQYTAPQTDAKFWIGGTGSKGKVENATAGDTGLISRITGASNADGIGVYGRCWPSNYWGIGVKGEGGYIGGYFISDADGFAVFGYNPNANAVYGYSGGVDYAGTFGYNTSGIGAYGGTNSGTSDATGGYNYMSGAYGALGSMADGAYGQTGDINGYGVNGYHTNSRGIGVNGIGNGLGGYWYPGEGAGGLFNGDTTGLVAWGAQKDIGVGVWGVGNNLGSRMRPSLGAGVIGNAGRGYGVYGTTDSATAGQSGVYGRSNATNGLGVVGVGNNISSYNYVAGSGVVGNGNYGVFGIPGTTNGMGVVGYNDASAERWGMLGGTYSGVQGVSNNTSGAGVFGQHTSGAGVGVYGTFTPASTDAYAVYGNGYVTQWYGYGGYFYGGYRGVYGSVNVASTQSGAGVYGVDPYPNNTTQWGVYAVGDMGCSGTKNAVVRTSRGPRVLYTIESPEVWFEDFGSGQLNNGRTHIELDPLFLETVTIDNNNPMKVYITLTDECNGVYVKKGRTGFDVIELNNGKSNATFDYRIVAKRKGVENRRLDLAEGEYTDPHLYPDPNDPEIPAKYREKRLLEEKGPIMLTAESPKEVSISKADILEKRPVSQKMQVVKRARVLKSTGIEKKGFNKKEENIK
ncbi:MAG: hypothetical protein ABIL70_03185 [candidate division WOR-3 bacterium]